jgi:hypothetical protein
MEDLLLYFFKDKPEVINNYYKYRPLTINIILLVIIGTALLAKNEMLRSLSLGMASGILLVNIGEGISRLRVSGSKKLHAGSESVNG